jgi:hypothetical protein
MQISPNFFRELALMNSDLSECRHEQCFGEARAITQACIQSLGAPLPSRLLDVAFPLTPSPLPEERENTRQSPFQEEVMVGLTVLPKCARLSGNEVA